MAGSSVGSKLRFISVIAFLFITLCMQSSYGIAEITPERRVSLVKETISSHPIVIFSKSYCPYCKKAKAVFKELNQEPYIVELDEEDDGPEIQQAVSEIVGRRTVPQVFIHGKHIGGSDDTVEAYLNGEIEKLLGISNEEL